MNTITPTKIRLLQCARKSCKLVLTEHERKWEKDLTLSGGSTAVCPECRYSEFHELKANGFKADPPHRIDANDIAPSPRLGPKMRAEMLAVKQRALEAV